ncbi:DUF1007 family protein [Sedimentitalea sp. HM32M-2]|uniref:DUF1007 family protein n=1 Tax=Sedimentitalea sp. HM32M-2 TaxID=3351566 RepID=UPI00362989BF
MPFLGLAGQAGAHPHVFVDAEVGIDINVSRLSSLHIAWTYDEFTTLNCSACYCSVFCSGPRVSILRMNRRHGWTRSRRNV